MKTNVYTESGLPAAPQRNAQGQPKPQNPKAPANWVGSEQVRFYELGDDRLVLRTPPITLGDEEITGVLTWQRQQ